MAKLEVSELKNRLRIIFDFDGNRPFCDHGKVLFLSIISFLISCRQFLPGPMLLFERESKSDQRFFACSAYRDRKLCPAYFLEKNWKKHHYAQEYYHGKIV